MGVVYVGMRMVGDVVEVMKVEAPWCKPLRPRAELLGQPVVPWGWGSSSVGMVQLALALLCDAIGDEVAARELHKRFAFQMLLFLPRHGWTIDAAVVEEWIIRQLALTAVKDDMSDIRLEDMIDEQA